MFRHLALKIFLINYVTFTYRGLFLVFKKKDFEKLSMA